MPPEVDAALQRARVPHDAVSVLLQEAGTGRTLLSHNAQTPVNPASLAKLLTTLAALDQLGPAWTWSTPVWLQGSVSDGVLDGSLVIKGSGDPKLVVERVWLLLRRVQQLGVREIRGDIVLDRSAFAPQQADPADFDGDPTRPYNVQPDALLLNFKSVTYSFVPDAPRGVALVRVDPALAGTQVDRTVRLSAGPCDDWRSGLKASFADAARVRFAGSYPAACGELELAGGRCRPGQLQRAADRGAVARHGRQAGRPRARRQRAGRPQAQLRAQVTAAGRRGARHQQVQQQRHGAAAVPDAGAAAPAGAAGHGRGGARGAARLAGGAHRRAAAGHAPRQRLGPVARDPAQRRAAGAAAAAGLEQPGRCPS